MESEPEKMATRRSWSRIPWLTVLIFILIAHFNPEILTGSTKAEAYLAPITLLGMLFYGLQVAVIADVAARFRLRWRTIYLLGLIYGIFEEGFAVQTMLSPRPPGFVDQFRILGLNVTWTIYIMIFHAIVSVLSSILIIRIIWPSRVSSSFLRRRHYAVIMPAIIIVYAVLIKFVTTAYSPEPSAILILALVCLVLAVLARSSEANELKPLASSPTGTGYLKWGVPLVLGSALVPFILSGTSNAALPVTVLLLVTGFLFAAFFGRMDRDSDLTGRKMLTIFALFIVFWLIAGGFFRTPFSSLVASLGVALQLYLGWRAFHSESAPLTTRLPEAHE